LTTARACATNCVDTSSGKPAENQCKLNLCEGPCDTCTAARGCPAPGACQTASGL
jgi:hypothetical protein